MMAPYMKKKSGLRTKSSRKTKPSIPETALLIWLRTSFNCKSRCSESSCRLDMAGIRHHVVLKGEEVVSSQNKGDYIIFWQPDNLTLGLIELKRTPADASHIQAQLQGCLDKSICILSSFGRGERPSRLVPAILAKGWKTMQLRQLGKRKLSFRGIKYRIGHAKCGSNFDIVCGRWGVDFR